MYKRFFEIYVNGFLLLTHVLMLTAGILDIKVLGILSIFMFLFTTSYIEWAEKKFELTDYFNTMLMIIGAAYTALTPAIIVSWVFRMRTPPESELFFEVFGLSVQIATSTLFVIIGIKAKRNYENFNENRKKVSFRQKVRNGDIKKETNRPID